VSYVRWGSDSSVYLIGTIHEGVHVIECCGCLLIPLDDDGYCTGRFPAFTAIEDAIAHLDEHRAHGDKVPDYAYDAIREDDWL
jgi:hypothetical protein